jgi:anti-anti-sigma factor
MRPVEPFSLESGDRPGSFRLSGELDIASAEAVRSRLEGELERTGELTLDTSDLRFMDSQGLRMLIDLGEQALKRDGSVQMLNCPKQVRRLLEVAVPTGIPGVEIVDKKGPDAR